MNTSREKICEVLCERNNCPTSISKCAGKMIKRCSKLKKSFINNLNDNQVRYITSSIKDDVFLKACPGSGKTEVVAIKCAYELKKWVQKYTGIAVITFTNSAEDEIRSRVEMFYGESLKYPHYVGTFTSWIHGYIANPFLSKVTNYEGNTEKDKSIKLIEGKSNPQFMDIFSSKYSYLNLGNIKPHEYYHEFKTDEYIYCGNRSFNGNQILQQLLGTDAWRKGDLKKIKKQFWKKGFCIYEDVEYLVYLLLCQEQEIANLIAQRFPIILIDECQDLSYVQLEIIKLLHEHGCIIHLIGDLDQAIYGFRNIEPEDTLDFIEELELQEMQLNLNYRSCQRIVDVSDLVINRNSGIMGCIEQKVSDPLIVLLYKKEQEREVVKKFNDLVKENGLKIGSSRIIVRNNTLKNKLLGLKNSSMSDNILEDLAKAIYLSVNGEHISEFKTSFLLFAKSVQKIYFKSSEHLNSRFYYKPSQLEMNEWKEIVSRIKSIIVSENLLLDFTRSWSEWKKILQTKLLRSVDILEELIECKCDLGKIRSGNASKKVEEILFLETNSMMDYKIETIHGCKGMSLDAVLFMSSYQAGNDKESGAYWRQWFDRTSVGEKNRLAYVAFSRARHLLVLGVPRPSTFTNDDKETLINYGFNVLEV